MDLDRAKLNVEYPEFALVLIWQSWSCYTDIDYDALEYLVKHSSRIMLSNVKEMSDEKKMLLRGYNGHLVIGFNDVFDTELGEVIRDSSVQGQFLKRIYKGKQDELDVDIETALQEYIGNRNLDPDKKRGKAWRYPIGTTITLGSYEKRYFLTAYGYMRNNLTVKSNSDDILTSLDKLWQEVRLKCHGTDVVIPIIGSDLARSGLSRMQLSKLIITSFVVASKREFITRKLTLMIYPKDLDSIDFYELEDFIKSICF